MVRKSNLRTKINGVHVNFKKAKKLKIREQRKASGVQERHKNAMKLVSSQRTAKHQKRVDHRQRMMERLDAAKAEAQEKPVAAQAETSKSSPDAMQEL